MSDNNAPPTAGQILWDVLKIIMLVIGGLVLIALLMRAFRFVLAIGVLAFLSWGVYRLLKRIFGTRELPGPEPQLRLGTDTDIDPLEAKFRELELEEARVDAEIERAEREN
ncbi:hypothetical protein EA187_14850 [Lujinxingia sediminis]|uniref:Uncharacterized protein n=1 Tax=Lujinxingia sediminis TaxID=2480984 RepID=A0ABY0CQL7_9DELT|nr:hypothetical protein [Lujinxingia sediminis]RVU42786.1 hypothetical protein EA187_14850 [Lujinxingia sediminis]